MRFNPVEMDLFFVIISKMRDREEAEVTLTFSDLKNLCNYSQRGYTRFLDTLKQTYLKYLSLKIINDDKASGIYTAFNLFSDFRIDEGKRTVTLSVQKKYSYILNKLTSNFTRWELSAFVSLSSEYSKSIFRLLKQYKSTGIYDVDISEFRRLLSVPEKYAVKDITRTILKPAIKELREKECFDDLVWEYEHEKKMGAPVKLIKFRFKPEKVPKRISGNKSGESRSTAKKSGFLCPDCGEELYEKEINGDNVWCHPDGWKEDAKCSRIFRTLAEVKGLE
jgi:plasmid replication initiation protein